jgi:hypothetical protein
LGVPFGPFIYLEYSKSYNKSVDILQTGFYQRNAMEKTAYKSDLKNKKKNCWCWSFWFPLNLTTKAPKIC